MTEDHGRILKNRIKIIPPPFDPLNPPLYVARGKFKPRYVSFVKLSTTPSAPHRENPFSKEGKQAIEGYYHPITNPGYSRKPNGNFFKV